MYHPSMWHPIQPVDMAAAFRSIRPVISSPNSSSTTSPEKNNNNNNLSAAVAAFNAANGAFSVNTLLNQSSSDHLRFATTHPSVAAAAAAAHHHHLFSTLFHQYPYAAAFRPLLNGNAGLLTSSAGSASSSSSSSSSESSAFIPAGKKFKNNTIDYDLPNRKIESTSGNNNHDENRCDTPPSERSSDESFGKYSSSETRCRSSTFDLQNPQCPICQISLNSQDMLNHIQLELDTIERHNHNRQTKYIRRSSHHHSHTNSNKILQENTINNIDQTFKTRYETYLRVRTSRQQRLNAKLQLHNRRSNRGETRNCPICYQTIPISNDDEYFFTHVQQCSRKREQMAANAAVAAIANHHRLPTTTSLDINRAALVLQAAELTQVINGGYGSTTTTTLPSDGNNGGDDPDINVVDMDDGGGAQEDSTHRQSTSETTLTSNASTSGTGSGHQPSNSPNQSDDRCHESFNSDQSCQKSPPITELDPPKCVVCMESCVKPCVSLNCWHINCEECWIKCLNDKKVCPQCDLTTTSDNLRRIFLNRVSN